MRQKTHKSASDRRLHQRVMLGLAGLVLGLPCVAQAVMMIRVHSPQRHDRFYAGVDKAFVGQPFDWSGVGKAGGAWVTMVSPSYYLSAYHLHPADGATVTFYEGNDGSTQHTYTIAGGQRISYAGSDSDLWLGELTTPLAPDHHINYYPILRLGSETSYLNRELFNYGKVDRVGRNVLDALEIVTDSYGSTGLSMIFDFDDDDVPDVGGDETFLQSGDSGGPSFAIWDGQLVLLGIHWFIGEWDEGAEFSGDTFVPHYIDAINDSMSGETLTVVPEPASIWVFTFYNNSAWDGGDGAANAADDNAIASDKMPLWHGMKATFANYTSYDQGINGLMIDVQGLPGTPTLNDFLFRKGNNDKPYGDDLDDPDDDWLWAPDPIAITVRPGEGQNGSDRVTLIWEEGVIRKCWLQVTVLATDATGLAENEVFYVGNAVGDSGNSVTDTAVNVVDALGVRANPHTLLRPAPIDDAYDYNRDGQVNVQDELIVRANPTTLLTDLNLIDLR